MSKRTERRAAERIARKVAFQELRQKPPQTPVAEPQVQQQLIPQHISEAQLAANRANAQLSTGPVTPEGQARSSRNALKFGLTGKTVLLPTEDPALYQAQLGLVNETFQPATEDELALVQSLFDANWRLNRIIRLENAILLKGHIEFAARYEDRPAAERGSLIEADCYIKYEKQLRNLNIQEARLRRLIQKDRAELTRLQAGRRRQEQVEQEARKKAEKSVIRPQNGFEFSTQPNPRPTSAETVQNQAA